LDGGYWRFYSLVMGRIFILERGSDGYYRNIQITGKTPAEMPGLPI
jgi:hypothetical protein